MDDSWDGDVFDFGYVDDMVFHVIANAGEILEKTKVAAEIVHNECLKFGLTVNYRAGKTEVLFHVRGKDAKKVNIEIFNTNRSKIYFEDMLGRKCTLQVTNLYKHLGGVSADSQNCMQELRLRCKDVLPALD